MVLEIHVLLETVPVLLETTYVILEAIHVILEAIHVLLEAIRVLVQVQYIITLLNYSIGARVQLLVTVLQNYTILINLNQFQSFLKIAMQYSNNELEQQHQNRNLLIIQCTIK